MPLIQWIMQNLVVREAPACLHIDRRKNVSVHVTAGENVKIGIEQRVNNQVAISSKLAAQVAIGLALGASISITLKVCKNMANNIGDDMRVEGTWTDADGSLVDPTSVQMLVLDPAGLVTIYTYPATIVRESLGVFYALVPLTESGTWLGRFISTGAGKAAEPFKFAVDPDAF